MERERARERIAADLRYLATPFSLSNGQIMIKLDSIVSAPEFQAQNADDIPLVNLYTNVVSTFELKLNFLKLAQFVECASRQITDVPKADAFIQNVIDNISASQVCKAAPCLVYPRQQLLHNEWTQHTYAYVCVRTLFWLYRSRILMSPSFI